MTYGSKPVDAGNLIINAGERAKLLKDSPEAASLVRAFVGSFEFINGIERWCLWLKDVPPTSWRQIPQIRDRVEKVRQFRLSSPKSKTIEQATTAFLFGEDRQPSKDYLAVPEVSSINRKFIPMGFVSADVIASNLIYTIPGASILTFGFLTSTMHMAWVRQVAGRLKSDYRYSAGLVYNSFPWPDLLAEKRIAAVRSAAESVLKAREPFLPPLGSATLADLYDPLTMPSPLSKAHVELDKAVDRCYRDTPFKTERDRVEHLLAQYEKLNTPLLQATGKRKPVKRDTANSKVETAAAEERVADKPEELEEPEESEDVQFETIVANPPWYEDALSKMQEGFSDDGTDCLADKLEEMISAGKFAECDADLGIIADREAQYPPDALISILTFSRSARFHLPNRERLRDAVYGRLVALGKNADAILRRL